MDGLLVVRAWFCTHQMAEKSGQFNEQDKQTLFFKASTLLI